MSGLRQRSLRTLPSTSEVLPSLISTAQARQILERRGDAREVFEQVARMRGQSERELMAEIASIVGLPCAEAINRTTVETPWDSEFLKHGALPEVIDGTVVGAYCIDPYRIRHLVSSELYQSIVLVPWSLLRSFKTHEQQTAVTVITPQESEPSTGTIALLELILDEAKSLGRDTVALFLTTRGISYEIQIDDGEPLTGLMEGSATMCRDELERHAERGDVIVLSGGSRVTLQKDALGRIMMKEVVDAPLCASLTPEPAIPYSPAVNAVSKKPKTVLLIEDDLTFSAIVSEVLAASGYHVASAPSLAQALTVLQKEPRLMQLLATSTLQTPPATIPSRTFSRAPT